MDWIDHATEDEISDRLDSEEMARDSEQRDMASNPDPELNLEMIVPKFLALPAGRFGVTHRRSLARSICLLGFTNEVQLTATRAERLARYFFTGRNVETMEAFAIAYCPQHQGTFIHEGGFRFPVEETPTHSVYVVVFSRGAGIATRAKSERKADSVWYYKDAAAALAAAKAWDPTHEPVGWYEHRPTGRIRPDGDPNQEYIQP